MSAGFDFRTLTAPPLWSCAFLASGSRRIRRSPPGGLDCRVCGEHLRATSSFDVFCLLSSDPLRPKAVDLRRSLALSLRHFYLVLRHPPKLLTASSTTLSASAWLWPAEAALDLPCLPGGEALRLECSDALGRSLSLLRGHLLLPSVYGF